MGHWHNQIILIQKHIEIALKCKGGQPIHRLPLEMLAGIHLLPYAFTTGIDACMQVVAWRCPDHATHLVERTEVDFLAQFQQLETLEAYRLRLPTYAVQTGLLLVRTLKHMKIKTVFVQWVAGRTFPNTEECTIIWPHYPENARARQRSVCAHFTYDDHITYPLII